MKTKLINTVVYFFLFTSFIGCNSEDTSCPDEQVSKFRISFNQNIITDSTNLLYVYLNDENYNPLENPEISDTLYNSVSIPTFIDVPLNISGNSASVLIDFHHIIVYSDTTKPNDTIFNYDTITIKYISNLMLEDLECDFIMEFEITDSLCTKNHIDSVSFTSSKINQDQETNVEIYF